MSKPIVMPIESLLSLEEGKPLSLLNVFFTNKGTEKEPHFTLEVQMDSDYVMFLSPFVQDIMGCLKESMKVVDVERLLKPAIISVPYAMIHIFADEQGFHAGSRFYQIEEEDLKKKGLTFYMKLNNLLEDFSQYVNELVEEYALMKDNEEVYSPREFEFLYKKVYGEWKYDSFVRMTDRMISEQKREIHGLLSKEIDTKLLTITNANEHVQTSRLAIRFYSDGLSINQIEVAGYQLGSHE